MFKLSPRLQAIYDQLEGGKPLWDFCCDHGRIGLWADVSDRFSEIHYVDQAAHLIEKIQELYLQKRGAGPWPRVGFHPCAGEDLSTPVRGIVVIAGVGGLNVRQILEGLEATGNLQADLLVLSPHGDETELQESPVLELNYSLHHELSVVEKGRKRFIFVYRMKAVYP